MVPPIPGVTEGHHNLSHHGKDPEKLEQLKTVESEEFKALAGLLAKLKNTQEEGTNLLDQTMVLFGSNLGNASSHNTKNMPVVLAGAQGGLGQWSWPALAAVYVLVVTPGIIAFTFAQKLFFKGLAEGVVKG